MLHIKPKVNVPDMGLLIVVLNMDLGSMLHISAPLAHNALAGVWMHALINDHFLELFHGFSVS